MCLVTSPQISSHVKAIDSIYQGTDFRGIRNISFMVKRIRVSCWYFEWRSVLRCLLVTEPCAVDVISSLQIFVYANDLFFCSSWIYVCLHGNLCHLSYLFLCFLTCVFQINDTNSAKDPSNPFRFANIGVEKFLELNSEQNHDDYCLAYVFSDRDFDDGVLGLAWVGAPSGLYKKQSHTHAQPCGDFLCCSETLTGAF